MVLLGYHKLYIMLELLGFMLEIIRKAGLSEGEIKVYSAILDTGIASVNLIHEKVSIERRNIYDILNKLIEKGLVSYSDENKKRTFKAVNPKRFLEIIDEKKSNLDILKKELEKELPLLIDKFNSTKPSISSEVFRGKEGIKATWNDMLISEKEEILWIGSGAYVPDMFPEFYANWTRRRVEKKVVISHLFREDKIDRVPKVPLQTLKILPKDFSRNPIAICIWGNKVGQFIFGEEIFIFVNNSKELAENYRVYFKSLWNNVCKPYKK